MQQSGQLDFLKTIPPGKSMMAYKGVDVIDWIAPMCLRVNVPPLKRKQQFREGDVPRKQPITKVRIHVEQAITRMKNICIFDIVIPLSQMGAINQIWTVCCLLTNFQPPLLDG